MTFRFCSALLAGVASYLVWTFGFAADKGCKLAPIVQLPIVMQGMQPTVRVRMNSSDETLLVDSGAFFSMISPASASALKLPLVPAPLGFSVVGVGGSTKPMIATVTSITIAGATLHNVQFLVGGNEDLSNIGVLGRNILTAGDAEYDLSQGVVRVLQPKDCDKTMLAYWTRPTESYSIVNLYAPDAVTRLGSHISERALPLEAGARSTAYVNGKPIRVLFDSGASTSSLSRKSAEGLGIKIDSPEVVAAGSSYGVGEREAKAWIAPVQSFKIGEEEIRNTRLRIIDGDFGASLGVDMLIGADFFLSHHIFIAHSQNKLYFTYNGGPVFNISGAKYAKADPAAVMPGGGASADTSAPNSPSPEEAADHARRGEAFASRRDLEQALAELNRACVLAPENPDYLYQRGKLYWETDRADLALQDFDQAIKLRPDDASFLMARAALTLPRDRAHATADLDAAAAALASSEASTAHYELAGAYERADILDSAKTQISIWIDAHPKDVHLYAALSFRCYVRALAGKDLDLARKDCDLALRHAAKGSTLLADAARARAMILLRSGDYQKSIDDFNASLSVAPRDAAALYGRGLVELQTRRQEQGQKDIAEAAALRPKIADFFAQHGLAGP